ncbi:MAG: hypothetical protein DHS20C09_08770 [marine bacterium B5-7]|nr:MAG: hypothetical protein DHS20C09_08770 [marine bacterium B5-7]
MTILLTDKTSHCNSRLAAFYDAADFILAGDNLAPEDKLHFFATAHFSNAKQDDVHKCCSHFRNRIDRVIFRRSGLRLYKGLWLEEGRQLTSNARDTAHAHWLIESPAGISHKAFKHVFTELWSDICGSKNLKFKPVWLEQGGALGVVNYCMKESDMGNTGTFIEPCSDNSRFQKNRHAVREKQR